MLGAADQGSDVCGWGRERAIGQSSERSPESRRRSLLGCLESRQLKYALSPGIPIPSETGGGQPTWNSDRSKRQMNFFDFYRGKSSPTEILQGKSAVIM